MTAPQDSLGPAVAFERHPAAIGHQAAPAVTDNGFAAITTWSPHVLAGEMDESAWEDVPAPAAPAPAPPPAGYRPPPVPVRPAASSERLLAVPVATVDPQPAPLAPHLPPDVVEDAGETTAAPADEPAPPPMLLEHEEAISTGPGPLLRPGTPDPYAYWDDDSGLIPMPRQVPRRSGLRPRIAAALVLTAVAAGLVLAAMLYLPRLLQPGQVITAILNAPMMVVRSAAAGRVTTVAATAAQLVEPQSPLLTIHTDDGKEDRPVLSGVHGVIRSVETVPGAALVAGAPLVRLQDCDRAFLTIPPDAKLQAGQTVQVKLPDQKPMTAKVRASAGVMEPPDSLVIGLEPGTLTASCPVGRSAAVTPVPG